MFSVVSNLKSHRKVIFLTAFSIYWRLPKTPFETKQVTVEFTSAIACEIENEGFLRLPTVNGHKLP